MVSCDSNPITNQGRERERERSQQPGRNTGASRQLISLNPKLTAT